MCMCVLGGSERGEGKGGRELFQRPNWVVPKGGLMEIDEGSSVEVPVQQALVNRVPLLSCLFLNIGAFPEGRWRFRSRALG